MEVGKALKTDKNRQISATELEKMATGFLTASKRCEMASLESLLGMGWLVSAISDLIHAVQRERGASNFYLGSGGGEFGEEMEGMIVETNTALGSVVQAWGGMVERVAAGEDRARLLDRLAHAAHVLAGLERLRGKVKDLKMTPREGLEAYTELVRSLLAIVFEAADAALDPPLSRILVALFNFMEGKEFAGQERATGTGAFATGGMDEPTRSRLLRMIDEQERCFEVFEEFAEGCSVEKWRAVLSGENQMRLEKLRRVACTDGTGAKMGPDFSRMWFGCTTRRIDEMKGIENLLAAHLQGLCEGKLEKAREELRGERRVPDVGFVLYCRRGVLDEAPGLSPEIGGPLLGRSLVEMLQWQAQRLQKLSHELGEAKEALEDRKTIEKAKGLLMKKRKISEQDAHKMLRDLAMKQSCRMAEVAGKLIAMESVWD